MNKNSDYQIISLTLALSPIRQTAVVCVYEKARALCIQVYRAAFHTTRNKQQSISPAGEPTATYNQAGREDFTQGI
jgi:hypothetical protein